MAQQPLPNISAGLKRYLCALGPEEPSDDSLSGDGDTGGQFARCPDETGNGTVKADSTGRRQIWSLVLIYM